MRDQPSRAASPPPAHAECFISVHLSQSGEAREEHAQTPRHGPRAAPAASAFPGGRGAGGSPTRLRPGRAGAAAPCTQPAPRRARHASWGQMPLQQPRGEVPGRQPRPWARTARPHRTPGPSAPHALPAHAHDWPAPHALPTHTARPARQWTRSPCVRRICQAGRRACVLGAPASPDRGRAWGGRSSVVLGPRHGCVCPHGGRRIYARATPCVDAGTAGNEHGALGPRGLPGPQGARVPRSC